MRHSKYENAFEKQLPSTSTPNNVLLSARKPIHHEGSISPIPTVKGVSKRKKSPNTKAGRYQRESESDSSESEVSFSTSEDERRQDIHYESKSRSNASHGSFPEAQEQRKRQTSNRKTISRSGSSSACFPQEISIGLTAKIPLKKVYLLVISIILTIVSIVAAVVMNHKSDVKSVPNTVTIEELKNYYRLQSDDTWSALVSGIDEVKIFKKPSVFLLLYENEAQETVNHMLTNISRYASRILNGNCEAHPIVLHSSDLSTVEARADYGYVINKYKPELEERLIMIVKDLDKVPGAVAQAFHSMCDEYTPLVAKTVFFFTMEMPHLENPHASDLHVVEEVLRSSWHDLPDDIFYPLVTRISNMVLRVVPEKL